MIEIKVDDLDVRVALERLAERIDAGLLPVREELADAIRGYFAEAFDDEGPPFGGSAWEPLEESTLRRHGRDDVLGGWGPMRDSLTQKGAPGGVDELSGDGRELTVGSEDPAAGFFAGGTSRQPARPFFPGDAPPELAAELRDILAKDLADPWRDLR